ncbi:MAG: preprotein translocase subunit SecY [Chlamydiae bacterium]|nr:preprotein translocase subunit SecY [Chlamydiota bacterium]
MFEGIKKIFSIADLRTKIVFTLLVLATCRIGTFIPVPGINGAVTIETFKSLTGGGQNLFQLMDVFSGGAFAQMTIFALGVMPYISSSIIMQLMMALVPSLQREVKETQDAGKRKLSRWTRVLTVLLALFQSALYAKYALQLNLSSPGIVVSEFIDKQVFGVPFLFYMVVMSTMTAGTMILMWMGEQISARGIGNGVSLIITLGILSSLPRTVGNIFGQLNLDSQEIGQITLSSLLILCVVFVSIIVGTILIIQGQRKIPLQYARRNIAGDESQQSNTAYIPLKINYAGVIPVIFASSLLMFPATIVQFLGSSSWAGQMAKWLSPGSIVYTILYIALILFFTYFWTATQFHPEQIASDMKKNGAFIPGIRQGKPTQDFLETTMNKITFAGAVFLALLAISPTLIGALLGVDQSIAYFFGGTSLLILVGVVLDTSKQIESHLLMKRYDGFMKKARLRGR